MPNGSSKPEAWIVSYAMNGDRLEWSKPKDCLRAVPLYRLSPGNGNVQVEILKRRLRLRDELYGALADYFRDENMADDEVLFRIKRAFRKE